MGSPFRSSDLRSGIGYFLDILCIAIFTCNHAFVLAFVLIFFGEIALNLNWSIVADILLYVVVPTRRGTAEAIQILFSHLFGDAGSPYLIGVVSDALKKDYITNGYVHANFDACPHDIRKFLSEDFKDFES